MLSEEFDELIYFQWYFIQTSAILSSTQARSYLFSLIFHINCCYVMLSSTLVIFTVRKITTTHTTIHQLSGKLQSLKAPPLPPPNHSLCTHNKKVTAQKHHLIVNIDKKEVKIITHKSKKYQIIFRRSFRIFVQVKTKEHFLSVKSPFIEMQVRFWKIRLLLRVIHIIKSEYRRHKNK